MRRLLFVLIAVLSMTVLTASLTSAASTQPPVTSFSKVLDPNVIQQPWAGGTLVWEITFTTNAPATNVTLEDNFLNGLIPFIFEPIDGTPSFDVNLVSVADNRWVVDANFPGTLPAGTYTFVTAARVDATKYAGRKYLGQAVTDSVNLYVNGVWKAGTSSRVPLQAPPPPSE